MIRVLNFPLVLLLLSEAICLCKFFPIRFGKTLVSQSEVDLRIFFLLFVLGLEIDILLVFVSEYNPSAIAPTPLEFVL